MKVISGSPSSNTEPYKCQRTLPKEKVRGVEKAPSNNTAWEEGTQRENTGQIREVRIATASDQNSARALAAQRGSVDLDTLRVHLHPRLVETKIKVPRTRNGRGENVTSSLSRPR